MIGRVRIKLFRDTVARPLNGEWHLMNRQERGFGELSMSFPTLEVITDKFAVRLGARGEDKHGPYVQILCGTVV